MMKLSLVILSLLVCSVQAQQEVPVICPGDVGECPDGSSVSRVPPDCEFDECPEKGQCTLDVAQCPDGSTVGREPPKCEFADCPDGACPLDVRTCPDGTTVGREPPKCEFEDCPVVCSGEVQECPDGTVISRIPPNCAFEECPPTDPPTTSPTPEPPTASPTTEAPTASPTTEPPTPEPSAEATPVPSATPTDSPTEAPSAEPTIDPTDSDPTVAPTDSDPAPSASPSASPTEAPSATPSAEPTETDGTSYPSSSPSATPSAVPSATPSDHPSMVPSASPSLAPSTSAAPSESVPSPSAQPSGMPTMGPVNCSEYQYKMDVPGLMGNVTLEYVVNVHLNDTALNNTDYNDIETFSLNNITNSSLLYGTMSARLIYEGQGWLGFAVSPDGGITMSMAIVGEPSLDGNATTGNVSLYLLGTTNTTNGTLVPEYTLLDESNETQPMILEAYIAQDENSTVMEFTVLLWEDWRNQTEDSPINGTGFNYFLVGHGIDSNKLGVGGQEWSSFNLTLEPCIPDVVEDWLEGWTEEGALETVGQALDELAGGAESVSRGDEEEEEEVPPPVPPPQPEKTSTGGVSVDLSGGTPQTLESGGASNVGRQRIAALLSTIVGSAFLFA